MPTSENKWSQRFLLGLTILWLVLGAGLFSYMGTVPTPLNSSIIRIASFILPDGQEILWQTAPVHLRLDLDRIETEVRKAESVLLTLGREFQPIRLRVNYQNPLRYRLSHEQIEIGSDIALKPGQLRHGIVKAWITQSLDARFSRSILRLNVLADTLIALSENGLSLTTPSNQEIYLGGEGATFAEQIGTFGTNCLSPWIPVDVVGLCQSLKSEHAMSSEVIAFSLRRTLAETIWASVSDMGAFERVQFLRQWLTYLKKQSVAGVKAELSPVTPVGIATWLSWTRDEFADLLPNELVGTQNPSSLKRVYLDARARAEKAYGLLPLGAIPVDLAARFESPDGLKHFEDDMVSKKYQIGQPTLKAAVVQIGKQSWLLPGRVLLAKEDLAVIRTRRSIWESCKYPSVENIVDAQVKADRVLLVRRCNGDKLKPLYRSYIGYGIEGFALDNPELQFVQIHRPSLEFAAEKGLMAHADFFQHLGQDYLTRTDRKLGLNDAQWNQQIGAFRVLGAIEAIEWFRLNKPSPN